MKLPVVRVGASVLLSLVSITSHAQFNIRPQEPSAAARVSITSNLNISNALASLSGQIGQTKIDVANVRKFYELRGLKSVWINAEGLSELGKDLKFFLTNRAEAHGLLGRYYWGADVQARAGARDSQSLLELEILLTNSYITFANDVSTGRINPKDKQQNVSDIEMRKVAAPTLSYLASLVAVEDTLNEIESIAPRSGAYRGLMRALTLLRMGQQLGGWKALSADRSAIKYGQSHVNIPAIRQRLVDTGFLPRESRFNTGTQYDNEMYQAMLRFQKNNALVADGVIGAGTYRVVDRTIESAITQTRANMEKWRFIPRTMPEKYLFVEMGRQELDVVENGQLADRMKVVVGKDLNGTPTMSDRISQIVINPFWHPPKSIIVKEILPIVKNDTGYWERNNMKILLNGQEVNPYTVNWSQYSAENPPPFLFRQETGPQNSLGQLKFDLNNAHAIYMHDTNNKEAFNNQVRYLSHGCIRLERPVDLAAYLLRDKGVDAYRIEEQQLDPAVRAQKVEVTPIAVYILGTTMTIFSDGTFALGPDIYTQDARIIQAMDMVGSTQTAPVVTQPAQ